MNFLRALVLSLLLVAPASAADYVAGPSGGSQLPGTATNDNAAAGNVGEYQSNSCATQTATVTFTGTTTNLVVWATSPTITALCPVFFTTTGTLPSGITASTTYYVTNNASLTSASFQISTTLALAQAGTAITLSTNGTPTTTGIEGSILGTTTVLAQTALNLTAGDWDTQCTLQFTGASSTTSTSEGVAISSSATTLGAQPGSLTLEDATLPATSTSSALPTPTVRVSLSATTIYYCTGYGVFATSTMQGNPFIRARRVR